MTELPRGALRRSLGSDSPGPTVIFIGSALVFSDQLLRVLALELPGLAPLRVATLDELAGDEDHGARQVCALVVDQGHAPALAAARDRYAAAARGAPVVLAYRDPEVARSFLPAGAACGPSIGFLPMSVQLDAWLAVLRLILMGEAFLPRELVTAPAAVADRAADGAPASAATEALASLSPREQQVLTLVSEGKQNKIIAGDLGLSEHTVKLHIHHIIEKLGVTNRTEAAAQYHAACPPGGGAGAAPA